jgi:hypothetical protein
MSGRHGSAEGGIGILIEERGHCPKPELAEPALASSKAFGRKPKRTDIKI